METEESFAYTTLFALKLKLTFENKRNLSILECFGARRVLEYQANDDGIYFKKIDQNKELKNFLDMYNDIVYRKDNDICLKKDVDVEILNAYIKDIDKSYPFCYDLKTFRYLNINSPLKLIYGLSMYLKKVEKLYDDIDENYHIIEECLNEISIYLKKIGTNDDYLSALFDIQKELVDKIEPYLLYPADIVNYFDSNYYDEKDDCILDKLNSPIQIAIFSSISLYQYKLLFSLEKIMYNKENKNMMNDINDDEYEYMEDIDDTNDYDEDIDSENINFTDEEIYFDPSLEDDLFALMYLENICNYLNSNYDDTLIKVKSRLKYIIDDDKINISNKSTNNLFDIINDYSFLNYHWYTDEAFYFLNEMFNNYCDEYYLRKLIFVKTYYDLTDDYQLIENMNLFKNCENYDEISNFILGGEKQKHI